MVFFAVVFVLMGITISQAFMLAGFCLAGLYSIYGTFCQRDYEYTLENDTLTIDVIYGNKYRKTAHELDLRELEMIAPHWHQAVAKYKKNGGTEHLKKYDYTSYEEDTPYYTMIIKEDGRKIKLLLVLTQVSSIPSKSKYRVKSFLHNLKRKECNIFTKWTHKFCEKVQKIHFLCFIW